MTFDANSAMDKIGFLFFVGLVATPVGYTIDQVFGTRFFTAIGVLFMAPLFLGIAAALSAAAALAVSDFISNLLATLGVPDIFVRYFSYIIVGILFVLILSIFFFGRSDFSGPPFWGSID